ncbi:NUDIX hydrolase [Granulicella cerasi]|uniref:NUDIX hydrolase n=1 Tax=Granulicella cerasi TaxID=741063 RepID=A0ABW1ZEA4_9BACT|nr:NUDIX domain-containing protein [Granulicella cerasi]
MRLRRSARVLLFDAQDNIFLIRFTAELDGKPFIFWVTPGGEVELLEDDHTAASRELLEEVGLSLPLIGPVLENTGGTYTHLGETVRNYDVYFAAWCEHDAPKLSGVTADEIRLMTEARWWSLEELASSTERVFPEQLAGLARQVLAERKPA